MNVYDTSPIIRTISITRADLVESQSSTEMAMAAASRTATRSATIESPSEMTEAATTTHSRSVKVTGIVRSAIAATLRSALSASSATLAKMELPARLVRAVSQAIGSVRSVQMTTLRSELSASDVEQARTAQRAQESRQVVDLEHAGVEEVAVEDVADLMAAEDVEVAVDSMAVVVAVVQEVDLVVDLAAQIESHSVDSMQSLRIRKSHSVMNKISVHQYVAN